MNLLFLKRVLLLSSLLLINLSFSQTFNERIGFPNNTCESLSFLAKNDTFFIPAFVIESYAPATYGIGIFQVLYDGTVISQKHFKRANVSFVISVHDHGVVELNNLYYLTSNTTAPTATYNSMALNCFNANADSSFFRIYGDTLYNFYGLGILKETKSLNKMIIFGVTDSTSGLGHPGLYKPIVWRIDSAGNVLSKNIYFSTLKYRADIKTDTTKNNGYIVSGYEYQHFSSFNGGAAFVLKLDSNLNQVWVQYFDTTVNQSILTLKSGKHLLAYGSIDSTVGTWSWSKIALIKLDENGGVLWKKKYFTHTRNSTATASKELPNGDLIITGGVDIPTGSINNPMQLVGFLMRTDSMGNVIWFNTYKWPSGTVDTTSQNYLWDVTCMPDGGFAAVGFVSPADGITYPSTWLLRVDSMGCLFPGCTTNIEAPFVQQNENELLIYPNPANAEITIKFAEGSGRNSCELLNSLGQTVLSSKTFHKSLVIKTEYLASGFYYVSVNSGGKFFTKKISVQH